MHIAVDIPNNIPNVVAPDQDAQELKADELIMDLTGWSEAERRHLRVTGTVGVLRAAARDGVINFKDALERLRQTNFHLSQKLYSQLIAETNQ